AGTVLVDLDKHVHRSDQRAGVVAQRGRIRHKTDAAAIGSLEDCLFAANRPVLPDRLRHRTLLMRQWRAVAAIEAPSEAPLVDAQLRFAAGKLGSGSVAEGDPAGGVRRVN